MEEENGFSLQVCKNEQEREGRSLSHAKLEYEIEVVLVIRAQLIVESTGKYSLSQAQCRGIDWVGLTEMSESPWGILSKDRILGDEAGKLRDTFINSNHLSGNSLVLV